MNAFVTSYATGGTTSYAIRIPVLAGLLIINAALYFATFTLLTAKPVGPRGLLPGAVLGAVAFTALITVGTGLMTHQLKNASATYGAFGGVIGIVALLLLLAKLRKQQERRHCQGLDKFPQIHRRMFPQRAEKRLPVYTDNAAERFSRLGGGQAFLRMDSGPPSAASSYVCPVDDAAESVVVGVVVAPDDVPSDHAGLFLVAGVVGTVEREVPQRGELRFDAV